MWRGVGGEDGIWLWAGAGRIRTNVQGRKDPSARCLLLGGGQEQGHYNARLH